MPIFKKLADGQKQILADFDNCQGNPVELGGYYLFDYDKARKAMNPSETLNAILDSIPRTAINDVSSVGKGGESTVAGLGKENVGIAQ